MAKILIVDDSMFMRNILKGIVDTAGHKEVFEASNGTEALSLIESEKPDLVLLDIIMPGDSGENVLEKIKKANKDQKVIMITAVGQNAMIEECKKQGVSDYIIKPFDNKKVADALKKVLG